MEPVKKSTKRTNDHIEGGNHNNQSVHGTELHPCHNNPHDACTTYHTPNATASHISWAVGGATKMADTTIQPKEAPRPLVTSHSNMAPMAPTPQQQQWPPPTRGTTPMAPPMVPPAPRQPSIPPHGAEQPRPKRMQISTEHSPNITGINAEDLHEQDPPPPDPTEYRNNSTTSGRTPQASTGTTTACTETHMSRSDSVPNYIGAHIPGPLRPQHTQVERPCS